MRRALVLGAGGPVGGAWEYGLIMGLAEGGVDVRQADLIIGTSSGSVVGARVAAGQDIGRAVREGLVDASGRVDPPVGGFDLEVSGEIFRRWLAGGATTDDGRREIGALALRARTSPEESWIETFDVGVEAWPEVELRIPAVDAETGERVVFDRSSGAALRHVIAGSCAVPGFFPPVSALGRRWIDGGLASGTNADLAAVVDPQFVIVVAPTWEGTSGFGGLAKRNLTHELATLEEAGAAVCVVTPAPTDVSAMGALLLDWGRVVAAREAGRVRGRTMAAREAAHWNPA